MTHIIPYNSGRIAILSDLHLDRYARTGQDFMTAHGLEAVLDDTVDALIIAGDLTSGPAARWVTGLNRLTPHIAPERIYPFQRHPRTTAFRLQRARTFESLKALLKVCATMNRNARVLRRHLH